MSTVNPVEPARWLGVARRKLTLSRLIGLVCAVFSLAVFADEARPPEPAEEQTNLAPSTAVPCRDCGVVKSIREIRTERRNTRPDIYVTSPQYLDTRPLDPPRIGPVFSLSWGKGERVQSKFGAVGTPNSPVRFTDITYEVLVQFEDGRFALIEQEDARNLRVGDRVRVVNKRVEPVKE